MDIYDVMHTTFAARDFHDEPVDDATLARILDHARFAPSGGNRQPWKGVVVRDAATPAALLPLIGPGVAVAALFAFLVSWSQYILTLLIGGGQIVTLPMLLFSSVSGGNPTSIAVIASLFAIPPLIAIALAARALSFGRAPVGQQY